MTRNAGVGYDIGFLLVYFLIERIVLFPKKIASIFLLYQKGYSTEFQNHSMLKNHLNPKA